MPWEYKNGNYVVKISDDGTKERIVEDGVEPDPEWPESMDVKVTNSCSGGCGYCHEMSVPGGPSFDVEDALRLFRPLPDGIEIAIGGGNPLERAMDLRWLRRNLGYPGPIFNMTVNSRHLVKAEPSDLYGNRAIGISYNRGDHQKVAEYVSSHKAYQQHVIHLIAGVHTVDDLANCLRDFDRVLVLGYKHVGRGVKFHSSSVDRCLNEWRSQIGKALDAAALLKRVVAFDNLALDQLDVRRFFTDERWKEIYMGDEGQFSMYMDLVKMEYAVNSTAEERFPIGEKTVREMFAHVKSLSSK